VDSLPNFFARVVSCSRSMSALIVKIWAGRSEKETARVPPSLDSPLSAAPKTFFVAGCGLCVPRCVFRAPAGPPQVTAGAADSRTGGFRNCGTVLLPPCIASWKCYVPAVHNRTGARFAAPHWRAAGHMEGSTLNIQDAINFIKGRSEEEITQTVGFA
jgi:hypothetical protein